MRRSEKEEEGLGAYNKIRTHHRKSGGKKIMVPAKEAWPKY